MNTLKPEVTVRKPNRSLNNFIISFAAALITSLVMNVGIRIGYDMGRQDAMMERGGATEDVACGISAPLECALALVKAGALLLHPKPYTFVGDGPQPWAEYGDAVPTPRVIETAAPLTECQKALAASRQDLGVYIEDLERCTGVSQDRYIELLRSKR